MLTSSAIAAAKHTPTSQLCIARCACSLRLRTQPTLINISTGASMLTMKAKSTVAGARVANMRALLRGIAGFVLAISDQIALRCSTNEAAKLAVERERSLKPHCSTVSRILTPAERCSTASDRRARWQ
jgi:hypothetical protein